MSDRSRFSTDRVFAWLINWLVAKAGKVGLNSLHMPELVTRCIRVRDANGVDRAYIGPRPDGAIRLELNGRDGRTRVLAWSDDTDSGVMGT